MSPNRGLGLVVLSLSVGFAPIQRIAAQTLPGWSYATNITIDSGDANNRISMAMRQRVTDRYLRTEFLQLSGMRRDVSAAEGTYTVFDARDSTATMVMPKQRMASVVDMAPMMSTPHPIFQIHSDGRSDYEDLGSGPPILGHATQHYRSTVHGTAEYTIAGRTCTKPVNRDTDMWIAADVDLKPALTAILKHFGSGADAMPDVSAVSDAGPAMPKGTPLRTITRSTSADADGASRVVTTTMEYVEISNAPIDQSAFVAPSDFEVMDTRSVLAKLDAHPDARAHMDSLKTAAARDLALRLCR